MALIPISAVLHRILLEIDTDTFDHPKLGLSLARHMPEMEPLKYSDYYRYILQFLDYLFDHDIVAKKYFANHELCSFSVTKELSTLDFDIIETPISKKIESDYFFHELIGMSNTLNLNSITIMADLGEAKQIKEIIKKSISNPKDSELYKQYSDLKEKCFKTHGCNQAITNTLRDYGLL